MHFTTSTVAILAIAAGVSAGVSGKKNEPPVDHKKAASIHATGASTGTHPTATTGTHPIVTGGPSHHNNTGPHGTSSIVVTSTAVCKNGKCTPVATPTATGGAGSGSSGWGSGSNGSGSGSNGEGSGSSNGEGAGNTPASPSSTGFIPSNPGSKVSAPIAGALIGSAAYGLMFLA
ncbi:hypothetical protein N7468_006044 [Penicillium chermesinum]|uniref:Uncharacterized protein n=1 Tax=Penicillium chermesinum TaxID=63820 RepID=A0A9W9P0F1_9EURO|nr:uncharacterized protein N7468_006044 [Penicillium chermesinum]KAJ5233088.1 hypothetical protein N7468_006044 [Penicillium chermesinum]KAJ6172722.1 hypothetical protein N7470_001789 [Penicillium chermesinum]